LPLFNVQIRLGFTNAFEPELIRLLVALSAGCPDGRAFLGVQHAELEAGHVGRLAHLSAHGVNLPRQVPFRQAANRRVAGHLPNAIRIHGQQQGPATHAGGRQRGFDAGVTGAYHNDFIVFGINEHR
jgi:hypothetical protein